MAGRNRGTKRPREDDPPQYDEKAYRIMRLMGFTEGKGLGRDRQGMVNPIEVHQRKRRAGLGLEAKMNEATEEIPEQLEWNTEEEIIIEEELEWIPPLNVPMPDLETLKSWLEQGKKKDIIDDETHFVDKDFLKWILKCKSALDHFEDKELFNARSRSNPYESIKKGIFQNRAAMKMANIDSVMGFQLTTPKLQNGEFVLGQQDLLYFADICAGPGGFSEYVLWKKKWMAKGFGFTLKGENDFKLHDFLTGRPESFEPHYGVKGDGDIYCPENCQSFIQYVLSQTENDGVHFVMADGGFSVAGRENIQEVLSRQLYLSQVMVALGIVRESGHVIMKLFDVFTPFSVGLVYLMRHCFHLVSLLKPVTSRPANSERYLICKWRNTEITPVFEYLRYIHELMWTMPKEEDVLDIVQLDLMKSDDSFFEYIKKGNDGNGKKQIQNLRKIVEFHCDRSLTEDRQWDIRTQCMDKWEIDMKEMRKRDIPETSEEEFYRIIQMTQSNAGFERMLDKDLKSTGQESLRSTYDWKVCVMENPEVKKSRGFFLSCGRNRIFRYDGMARWKPLEHYQKFEMSPDTLVYGEIVTEYRGEGKDQKKTCVFHIIDGLILGGKDISRMSLSDRWEWCAVFAKAMDKTHTVSGLGSFRAKELLELRNFRVLHAGLKSMPLSGGGKMEKLVAPVTLSNFPVYPLDTPYIQPAGILFLKEIQDPWLVAFSRSQNKMYYFNYKTNAKQYDFPPDAIASFGVTMSSRMFWHWDNNVDLGLVKTETAAVNRIHAEDIFNRIEEIKVRGVQ